MRVKKIKNLQAKEYYEKMALLWWQNLSKDAQMDFLVKRICNAKAFKQFLDNERFKDITLLFEIQENGDFKYNKKAVKIAS